MASGYINSVTLPPQAKHPILPTVFWSIPISVVPSCRNVPGIYRSSKTCRYGGDETTALQYFNLLRTRAYENNSGNVSSFTLDDVLKERQRELYWKEAVAQT